ncbi:MAG: VanZ family protein [Candidatus Omnitrophica bacterium]|nr:VanZ family protein [Candidatus Omnitrophota bacterium]
MAVNTVNKKISHLAYLWLFVLLVMGVIFAFSALPAREIPSLFPFEDIVFHLLAYGLLAFSFCQAINGTFSGLIKAQLVLYSIIFCTTYGISDEYHQLFVPGRCCSGFDIFIDGLGGFLGSLFYCIRASIPGIRVLFAKENL